MQFMKSIRGFFALAVIMVLTGVTIAYAANASTGTSSGGGEVSFAAAG